MAKCKAKKRKPDTAYVLHLTVDEAFVLAHVLSRTGGGIYSSKEETEVRLSPQQTIPWVRMALEQALEKNEDIGSESINAGISSKGEITLVGWG